MGVLAPCTHEEAGTLLMVHTFDATSSGHRRIRIRSNDADVIVLGISVASTLQADEVWVTYGSGKNVQNIPANAVATSLGQCSTLLLDVILSRFLVVAEKRPRGMCGKFFLN